MDINLDKSSGFELCGKLRKSSDIPILFISARRSGDVLLALNIGGGDYIRKRYSLSILPAKVRAALKRYGGKPEIFRFGDFRLDFGMERLSGGGGEIKLKAMDYKLLACLIRLGLARSLSKWKFVGERLPAGDASVYLPFMMKIDGGYEVSDQIKMDFKEQSHTFTVKGFTEDAYFSSLDTGVLGVYLPEEALRGVERTPEDDYRVRLVFANLKEKDKKAETKIRDHPAGAGGIHVGAVRHDTQPDLHLVRMSRTMIAGIISVMTAAFSAVITIVCLIVVRFRIGNSIGEDMAKIGFLKAAGYTSGQIVLSVVTQFLLIAVAGCAAGGKIPCGGFP